MVILQKTEIHGVSNVLSTARRQIKAMDLMLGFNETIDQLSMVNSVRWYGHVLRREDGHILRSALGFEVEGQKKKLRLIATRLG